MGGNLLNNGSLESSGFYSYLISQHNESSNHIPPALTVKGHMALASLVDFLPETLSMYICSQQIFILRLLLIHTQSWCNPSSRIGFKCRLSY